MDLFGFGAMGLISGLGGGIIRDILLQHGTPVALTHAAYIPTALAGAGMAFLAHRVAHAAERGIDLFPHPRGDAAVTPARQPSYNDSIPRGTGRLDSPGGCPETT
jgi:hypothetical protein